MALPQILPLPYEQRIVRRDGETWPRRTGAAGAPYAWAQHRLDMVAAVPWFKSSQGGVYMTPVARQPQYVLGMYVSGFAGARAYMDAEVIITSLNGDQGNTPKSAETVRRHTAMQNNVDHRRLVGVIIGSGATRNGRRVGLKTSRDREAPLFPCVGMPGGTQDCWVAGFFLPTLVWAEKTQNIAADATTSFVWMVRLEKFDLDQQSWWANMLHGMPPPDNQRNFSYSIRQEVCGTCRKPSPRIFREMFLCTQEDCADIWKHNGRQVATTEHLEYTDDFLLARTLRPLTNVGYPMDNPRVLEDFNAWWSARWLGPSQQQLTAANFRERMGDLLQGFRCPLCHMLGPRVRWHQWHCRNAHCGRSIDGQPGAAFVINGEPPIISLAQITTLGQRSLTNMNSIISQTGYRSNLNTGLFTAYEFFLGEDCRLAYLVPNHGTNAMPGSSDDLYQRVQELAADGTIPLKRRWMNSPAGPCLTSHFSVNYGEQYAYGAAVRTIPFGDPNCPREIVAATHQVNGWTSRWYASQQPQANELYLAGYFSGQKMNWHDDGETGLGDVITTYTLGGQGTFRVAIKAKYNAMRMDHARDPKYDPVIPGCAHEQARRELKRRRDNGQITDAQWQHEVTELCKTATKSRKLLLSLPVYHGYIVVMYGAKTQTYLDHCVEVDTPLRFALTFRHIKPEHMSAEDRRRVAERLAYDVEYDPDSDPTARQNLDSVGDDPNEPGDELPAASPRDSPVPRRRRRINSHGDSVGDPDDVGNSSAAATPDRRSSRLATSLPADDDDVEMTDSSPAPSQPSNTAATTAGQRRGRGGATEQSTSSTVVSGRVTRGRTTRQTAAAAAAAGTGTRARGGVTAAQGATAALRGARSRSRRP